MAKASPPGPHCPGSASQHMAAMASVASTALPPAARTRCPAPLTAGWLAATMCSPAYTVLRGAAGQVVATALPGRPAPTRATGLDVLRCHPNVDVPVLLAYRIGLDRFGGRRLDRFAGLEVEDAAV